MNYKCIYVCMHACMYIRMCVCIFMNGNKLLISAACQIRVPFPYSGIRFVRRLMMLSVICARGKSWICT